MSREGTITVSAPGKLFLIGEYAVLEKAPAILTAVNRRARVTLYPARDRQWHLTAVNLGIHDLLLDEHGRTSHISDPGLLDKLRVHEAVMAHVTDKLAQPLPPLAIEIDTAEFAQDGYKLGLGSSAAVAVALSKALLVQAGIDMAPNELMQLANAAHRHAQSGTGSGGDVATAVYGGLISYRRDQTPSPLNWPKGLAVKAVITGQGASTTELVGRVYQYKAADPAGFSQDLAPLVELCRQASRNLAKGQHFTQLADDYFSTLQQLDKHARAGIVTPRHRELHALAAHYGAVFKSCGAGGGDVGLLFTTPDMDERSLFAEFNADSATLLDLGFADDGVRRD